MNNLFAPESCPLCNNGIWKPYADGTYQFRYGRKSHSVSGQHYATCDKCGTRGYLPGQRDANQKLIREYQKAMPGYISPSDVLALREKYILTQEQAGLIFGGGKQGFSKWECGKTAPAGPTARLIKLALNIPDVMRILALDAGIQLPEPVAHDRRITDKKELYRFASRREELPLPEVYAKQIIDELARHWNVIGNRSTTYDSESISGKAPIADDVPKDDNHLLH